jgi:hypothetical protein
VPPALTSGRRSRGEVCRRAEVCRWGVRSAAGLRAAAGLRSAGSRAIPRFAGGRHPPGGPRCPESSASGSRGVPNGRNRVVKCQHWSQLVEEKRRNVPPRQIARANTAALRPNVALHEKRVITIRRNVALHEKRVITIRRIVARRRSGWRACAAAPTKRGTWAERVASLPAAPSLPSPPSLPIPSTCDAAQTGATARSRPAPSRAGRRPSSVSRSDGTGNGRFRSGR